MRFSVCLEWFCSRPHRLSAVIALFGLLFCLPVLCKAQETPTAGTPFPRSSARVADHVRERLQNLDASKPEATRNLSRTMALFDGGSFQPHPWTNGNPLSELDFQTDSAKTVVSLKDFVGCFEPKLVKPFCPFCYPQKFREYKSPGSCPRRDNTGEMWEYWWPEVEIEINNFGISSLNPVTVDANHLQRDRLVQALQTELSPQFLQQLSQTLGFIPEDTRPDGLKSPPNIGQTHFSGQLTPDQTFQGQAHVYRNALTERAADERPNGDGKFIFKAYKSKTTGICFPTQLFWVNGYKKKRKCFLDALPKKIDETIFGWTEQSEYLPHWTFPVLSTTINAEHFRNSIVSPLSTANLTEFSLNLRNTDLGVRWLEQDSCASFRIKRWPSPYKELQNAFNITPRELEPEDDPLRFLCYQQSQLYPLTGTVTGPTHDIVSASYLARRAIELMTQLNNQTSRVPEADALPYFADYDRTNYRRGLDKLQISYPGKPSKCFHMDNLHELNNDIIATKESLPADDLNGSIRLMLWNKRTTCTCPYRGAHEPGSFFPLPVSYQFTELPIPWGRGCYSYNCNPLDIPEQIVSGTFNADSALCPLLPDLLEDERIGNGDLETEDDLAIIFAENTLIPFSSVFDRFPTFAKAAARAFPFGF